MLIKPAEHLWLELTWQACITLYKHSLNSYSVNIQQLLDSHMLWGCAGGLAGSKSLPGTGAAGKKRPAIRSRLLALSPSGQLCLPLCDELSPICNAVPQAAVLAQDLN